MWSWHTQDIEHGISKFFFFFLQAWEEAHQPSVTARPTSALSVWYSLVVHGDVAEQVSHGLSIVDAADGLGQNHADVHRLDFGTLQLLHFMGDCVSHHHLQTQQTQRLGLDWRWFLLGLKPTSTSKCIVVFVISGFHFSHLGYLLMLSGYSCMVSKTSCAHIIPHY